MKICIEIEDAVLENMKDIYRRLMKANTFDTRTFEQWVADIAVYGIEPDKKWLEKYARRIT